MREVEQDRVGPMGRPSPDVEAMKDLLHFAWKKRGDTTPESRLVIRSILTAFVAKGGSIADAQELKERLKTMAPAELDDLLAAINDPDVSSTKVLQDRGLAEPRTFHDHLAGVWVDEPDHRAFTFDKLKVEETQLGGEHVIKRDTDKNDFFKFETHDAKDWMYTGNKMHISVNVDQLGEAWDACCPCCWRIVMSSRSSRSPISTSWGRRSRSFPLGPRTVS